MTDKTFDPQVLFDAIPSFYRDQLAETDKGILGTFWTGLVRLADAEYLRLFQTVDSIKTREAPVNTAHPWIYQEFGTWTSRGARHQHRIIRKVGAVDGIFYLGRHVDPRFVKLYYDGFRRRVDSPSIVTNDPDAAQIIHLITSGGSGEPLGTRIEIREMDDVGVVGESTAFGDPLKDVVIEAERELHSGMIISDGLLSTVNAVWVDENDVTVPGQKIDPDQARVRIDNYLLNVVPGYTISGVADEHPTVSIPAGFVAGQVIRVIRLNGHVNDEVITESGSTYTVVQSRTEAGGSNVAAVLIQQEIQLYPKPVDILSSRLTFAEPLPVGVRVRVTDPAGTQSFVVDRSRRSFTLENEVDPRNTSVFIHNLDLTAITVTENGYDFVRAPTSGMLVSFEAPLVFPHDHARFTAVLAQAADTVFFPSLPSTRPMALNADLTESARYPVKVYVNGRLLEAGAYQFNSTTEIQLTSGTFLKGDRIDIVYTDAEENEPHIHFYEQTEVPANVEQSVVVLPEPVEGDRYPVLLEQQDGPLFSGANHTLALDQFVQIRPTITGSAVLFTEGAARGLNYRQRVPGREDVDENYLGTIVSAESLQDGIDLPTQQSTGTALKIFREGDETVVETDIAYESGWFKNAQVDEHLVNNALGVPIGFLDGGESTPRYRDVTMALYAAYYQGSQVSTLENFGCIILGSAFARKDGSNKGVVSLDGEGRVRRVEDSTGVQDDVALHPLIPDRDPGLSVPLFHAMSAYCELTDRDLSGLPWLAFFAESVSDEYRYAKRIDVRTPREHSGTVDNYNELTETLTDNKSDFIDLEVWPNDLIRLSSTGNNQGGLNIAAITVYTRVIEVIDEHNLRVAVELEEGGFGWGEPDGWGETTGWGGFAGVDELDNYTIWTRKTRRIDTYKFLDEALDQTQALADGEAVQKINEALTPILSPFIFAVKINWEANRDAKTLNDFGMFLDTAKAADTGYFAYTEVNNDDGIFDTLGAAVVDREPELVRDGRYTFVELDFIESMFIAPAVVAAGIGDVTFDDNWWDPTS